MTSLRDILSVPTRTGQEHHMQKWLNIALDKLGVPHYQDAAGNIYATKGTAKSYPCVCAHMDTIHALDDIVIRENDVGHLYATNNTGTPTGCGGDDKCGIFICLQLIQTLDVCKAAFFVSEESGCIGAKASDPCFFADVAYAIEFDSPCDSIMSFSNDCVQLFAVGSAFFRRVYPLLMKYGITRWQHHPYTDVSVLKRRHDFPCLNLPAGYFRPHTRYEYVVPRVVSNSIDLGKELISVLGRKKFVCRHLGKEMPFELPEYNVNIGGLETHDYEHITTQRQEQI